MFKMYNFCFKTFKSLLHKPNLFYNIILLKASRFLKATDKFVKLKCCPCRVCAPCSFSPLEKLSYYPTALCECVSQPHNSQGRALVSKADQNGRGKFEEHFSRAGCFEHANELKKPPKLSGGAASVSATSISARGEICVCEAKTAALPSWIFKRRPLACALCFSQVCA